MRVIAGSRKSRRLHAPPGDATRPTHDRVKEALFSMLGSVQGLSVVDLYAGTGALGIEALSRGARRACFVERARAALDCLRRNLRELDLVDASTVIAKSVESSQAELCRLGPHDLVFCDPPWAQLNQVVKLLSRLEPKRWLTPHGLLVLEHPSKFDPSSHGIAGMVVVDGRAWGDAAVSFFASETTGLEHLDSPP